MLEIFFLIWFGRKLAGMATAKGRSGGWAALGVCLWIVGEIAGAAVGAAMDLGGGMYLLAIVCAIAGAVIGYIVVNSLSEAGSYSPGGGDGGGNIQGGSSGGGGGIGTVWPK